MVCDMGEAYPVLFELHRYLGFRCGDIVADVLARHGFRDDFDVRDAHVASSHFIRMDGKNQDLGNGFKDEHPDVMG